jgi:hypothetical protein
MSFFIDIGFLTKVWLLKTLGICIGFVTLTMQVHQIICTQSCHVYFGLIRIYVLELPSKVILNVICNKGLHITLLQILLHLINHKC